MKKERAVSNISLKIILENDNGEVLILNGAKGGIFEGFYDLPGGRIDEDEFLSPIDEIINREIIEEVGNIEYKLDISPIAIGRDIIIVSDKDKRNLIYILFKAKYISGEIIISHEHSGYKWRKLNAIEFPNLFTRGILDAMENYLL